MISKYRKIFLTTFIITLFLAWFSFFPVGYFTYLCIFDPLLLLYSIYTLNQSTSPFSLKRGTPEHVLHRSQGRNPSGRKSCSFSNKEVSVRVISITNQHMKINFKHVQFVLRNQLWKQILIGNRVPSGEQYIFKAKQPKVFHVFKSRTVQINCRNKLLP